MAAGGPDDVREQVTSRADDDHGSQADVADRVVSGEQQWRPGLLARARKELEVHAAATGINGHCQQTVAAAAQSFVEFPPMQQAASFNLEEVKKKVEQMMKSHEGQ